MNNDPVDCVGIRSDVTLHCTMGILNSKSSQSNLKMKEALNALHPTVHVMQLYDGDIKMIRKCFNKMDRKRDGLIYLDEFRFHLQAEDCSFTQKILKMFCCGCREHLQFGEFLMMCWIYCTLNREKLGNDYQTEDFKQFSSSEDFDLSFNASLSLIFCYNAQKNFFSIYMTKTVVRFYRKKTFKNSLLIYMVRVTP